MYCKSPPNTVLLLSFFLSKVNISKLRAAISPAQWGQNGSFLIFLPAPWWIVHVLLVHKLVLSVWAQVCKNTRSICAFRIKKHKAGQLKLGITIYPCKHNIIPTESLGKTTQYLLTVALLCLLSCSSAATEISCGDSPKPLNTAAEF